MDLDPADQRKLHYLQSSLFTARSHKNTSPHITASNHLRACLILSAEAIDPSVPATLRDDARILEERAYGELDKAFFADGGVVADVETGVQEALERMKEKDGFVSRLGEVEETVELEDLLDLKCFVADTDEPPLPNFHSLLNPDPPKLDPGPTRGTPDIRRDVEICTAALSRIRDPPLSTSADESTAQGPKTTAASNGPPYRPLAPPQVRPSLAGFAYRPKEGRKRGYSAAVGGIVLSSGEDVAGEGVDASDQTGHENERQRVNPHNLRPRTSYVGLVEEDVMNLDDGVDEMVGVGGRGDGRMVPASKEKINDQVRESLVQYTANNMCILLSFIYIEPPLAISGTDDRPRIPSQTQQPSPHATAASPTATAHRRSQETGAGRRGAGASGREALKVRVAARLKDGERARGRGGRGDGKQEWVGHYHAHDEQTQQSRPFFHIIRPPCLLASILHYPPSTSAYNLTGGTNAGRNTSKRGVKPSYSNALGGSNGNGNGNGGGVGTESDEAVAPVDERLRNIEPRMIEMINNEVGWEGNCVCCGWLFGLHSRKRSDRLVVRILDRSDVAQRLCNFALLN
ncbi:hypothetical protein BC936DRAFT_140095 [Jimgerdemannia flammicorona]|uniref:Uncharacterized protein n=1 Tax=Jimgerdemannia flammicorona TaxID=994334 RepID=A0A433B2B2_9FUNG|nr:hypothetical protein BC936DRAFT_140095 [Jimgerdemannia flammicorona]